MSKKPPADLPIKPQDIPPNELPEQRRISPFLFIVLAVTGLTAVLGVFFAIVFAVQPAELPVSASSTALQSVEMPDGSTLSLEAVTWGTSHNHVVKYETRSMFSTQNHTMHVGHHSHPASIVLWFSCRDAGGRIRDFSWWSHCTALDSAGNEHRDVDAEARQFAIHEHGYQNKDGRPFPAIGGARFRRIIASTTIKPLRHSGDTFPVQIFDTSGNLVGEFEIADPGTENGKYPEWTAEELPITRDLGDGLTVTLATLRGELQESNTTRNGQRMIVERQRIRRKFLFHQDGKLLQNVWDPNTVTLNDAFGNRDREYNVDALSESEPVWRMFSHFYRSEEEKNFDESEKWTVTNVKVAPAGKQLHLGTKKKVAGAELEIIATGGPGKLTYKDLYPVGVGAGTLNGPIGGTMNDKRPTVPFRVVSERDPHAPGQLMVDCQLPHILFRWSAQTPQPHVRAIKATDDQGRRIQIYGSYPGRGGQPAVYILRRHHQDDSSDPITSVNVTFIVNRPRQAEFFFKRPEFRRPVLGEQRRRTPQQWLATSRKQIAQHEANLKQQPENAQRNYAFAWAIVTAPEELRTSDRITRALECAKLAVRQTPDSGVFGTTLGLALLRDGKVDEAIVRFQDNLKMNRSADLPVHDLYGLAMAHSLAGDDDEADRVYQRGLRKHRMKDRFLRGVSKSASCATNCRRCSLNRTRQICLLKSTR